MKIAALSLALCAGLASAQAITGFTGGSAFAGWSTEAGGDTIGWQFTLNQDIIVTDLGVWIDADGLQASHQVGIWDLATGNLLVSAVAGPGGTAVGGWSYADAADTVLSASGSYVIGASYQINDGDSYISSATSVSTSADVNFGGGTRPSVNGLGFALPDVLTGTTSRGRFGPNFLYTPVPAPSALALLGLGGLAAARRRR